MVSNPVEVPKFFRVNLQLLKLQLPTGRTYLHLNLYFRSSRHLHSILRSLLSVRCLLLRYSFGPGFPRRVCLPRHYTNLNYSNLFSMTIQANKIFKPAALGFTSESFFTLSTEIKIEHDFGLQTRRPLSDLITHVILLYSTSVLLHWLFHTVVMLFTCAKSVVFVQSYFVMFLFYTCLKFCQLLGKFIQNSRLTILN